MKEDAFQKSRLSTRTRFHQQGNCGLVYGSLVVARVAAHKHEEPCFHLQKTAERSLSTLPVMAGINDFAIMNRYRSDRLLPRQGNRQQAA